MTRLPRDLSGAQLIAALQRLGYQITRQTGSHVRLSSNFPEAHHLTVPNHDPLRVGTLAAILAEVAQRQSLTREEPIRKLLE